MKIIFHGQNECMWTRPHRRHQLMSRIINSFIIVDGRRLSNGIMESRNSIVKLIKKTGNGYVNFARFRNRCMYCMNENALPSLSGAQIPIKMKGKKRGSYKK